MIQSRPQFGYVGALLVWVVALIAYIGFNSFNQILAAQTVHALYGLESGPTMLVFTLLSLALAVVGYDLIHLAQRWIAYVLIVALLVFTVVVAVKAPLSVSSRVARLSRRILSRAVLRGGLLPDLVVHLCVRLFALSAAQRRGERLVLVDLSGGLRGRLVDHAGRDHRRGPQPDAGGRAALQTAANALLPGLGQPLLLCSLLGLVTITSLNFYGASLTLMSVLDSLRPSRPTLAKRMLTLLIAAVAASALAAISTENFVAKFGAFLSVLLYLFTPWTAINLVDFYWVRKGHYSVREIFNPRGMYGRWNWRGLLAYAVGFVSMIPFFSTGIYTGPVAARLGGADLAMLVGLPVSALVYLAACRSLDVDEDRRRAAHADAGLDPAR